MMNAADVMALFLLYAGLSDGQKWIPLVDIVCKEISADCKPDVDCNDPRLIHYAAALAHLRYRTLCMAQGERAHTYAGTATAEIDTAPQRMALELVETYRKAAAGLLTDRQFAFANIPELES